MSQTLVNGMPIYPGDPAPSFENYATLDKNGVNLTRLVLGSHTGTHTDAPKHFISGGISVDQIPTSKLIGEAFVCDISQVPIGSGITQSDLEPKLGSFVNAGDAVILYTGCSDHWGEESVNSNYTYLTAEAARYLVNRKIRAVGIDFLSVEMFGAKEPIAHKTLLGNGIYIIESISSSVKQFLRKRILLICLPIKLGGGDGSPSRVLAVPIDSF
ncbi:MAG: cyclase family protein [Nitrososphaerota archaeon]|nr:cyclase family protein [Nitrososphaerota archaeon]